MNNRYSLMARYLDTKEIKIIELPKRIIQDDKTCYDNLHTLTKTSLAYIDSLTQKYTKEEFTRALKNNKLVDSINVDIFISYRHDDSLHYVETLYKDDPRFYNLTVDFGANIPMDSGKFSDVCVVWYNKLGDPEFRKFLRKSTKLNNHIKDNIKEKYKIDDVNNHFYERKIKEDLSKYKILRDMYEVYKEYKNPDYLKQVNNNVNLRNECLIKKQEESKPSYLENQIKEYQETKEYLLNNLYNGSLNDEDELWVHKDLDDIINESGVKK